MSQAKEIVVIGGGHNGLVAAAWLARAGQRVTLCERRPILGGLGATEELWPGLRVDTGHGDASLLLPVLAKQLQLGKNGLELLKTRAACLVAGEPGEEPLTIWADARRTAEGLKAGSPEDAKQYPRLVRQLGKLAPVVAGMRTLTPPPLEEGSSGWLGWGRLAMRARRLGRRDLMELMRVLPIPVDQLLGEWLENDRLKGALAAMALHGSHVGPMQAGTAYLLLYHGMPADRSAAFVKGGMGQLAMAIAQAARGHGARIRTEAGVRRILVRGGRAIGVELEGGERLDADVVLSTADPRHTFFDLVGPERLELRMVRRLKSLRVSGAVVRLHLALSELPPVCGLAPDDERLRGRIALTPGLAGMERAWDDAKYGQPSRRPFLIARVPTLLDPSLAPAGTHLLSVDMQYAPLRGVATGEPWRGEVEERILGLLEAHVPGLRGCIRERVLHTPGDIQRLHGATAGDVHHVQMGLDQLLIARPLAGCSRYRTPIEGLWLGGSGSHPGGGVTGAPGYNAAREILAALG